MKAGRELDALIAEKVMGRTRGTAYCAWSRREANIWRDSNGIEVACEDCPPIRQLPAYSADIAAAWQVVEKMRELGWWSVLSVKKKGGISIQFGQGIKGCPIKIEAATAPAAICLAALKAVGCELEVTA